MGMKKWLRTLLAVVVVCLLGMGGYGVHVYQSIRETANKMYLPIRTQKTAIPSTPVSGPVSKPENVLPRSLPDEPVTLLLLGVDEREQDKGRSDVILVLTVNPRSQSALMLSIPRDTRTQIAHRGTMDKINHAYAYGGVQLAVDTVEQFLGVPVDYVVTANMEGFASIIDTLGGVDVENKLAFTYADYSFPVGPIHLDGKKALIYARMRSDDPRGDLGRNERQQLIIKALLAKGAKLASPAMLGDVLKEMEEHVRTNMTFDVMKQLALTYSTAVSEVESIRIQGRGELINGIYYYIVSQQERQAIRNRQTAFRARTQLETNVPARASEIVEWQRGGRDE
jgi:LCP family protein required for cell wall assembly